MNVCIVSSLFPQPDRPTHGVFVLRHVQQLRAQGLDANVLSPVPLRSGRTPSWHGESECEGVPVRYIGYPWIPLRLSPVAHGSLIRATVLKALRSVGPVDVIHAHWIFPTAWAVAGRRSRAATVIATARGSDIHTYPARSRRVKRLTQAAIRNADVVTAVSGALADAVRALAKSRLPVEVTYNGVNSEQFRPPRSRNRARDVVGLPHDRRYCISVGRLAEAKGMRDVLAAFTLIAEESLDVDLILLGDGPDGDGLKRDVASLGLSERVLFPGNCRPREVASWLQASDAFVFASHMEGLPNAVLEAMSTGLPVIATDVGGTGEAVENGVTGWLVPAKQPRILYKHMQRVLADSILSDRIGSQARARIEERFSAPACARRWIALYERSIATYQKLRSPLARPESDWPR